MSQKRSVASPKKAQPTNEQAEAEQERKETEEALYLTRI